MAEIFISLGSNIEKEVNIPSALSALALLFGESDLSSLYLCDAVGFSGPEFYNMVARYQTDKSVVEVIELCKQLEIDHGRPLIAKKNQPRTLDLDLLLYDDLVMTSPAVIPRSEIISRAFVLWPLAEIAPNMLHPQLKTSYGDMWFAFNKQQQKIRTLPFQWPANS